MARIMSFDPVMGCYVPAIPEPFWYKSWRTWFRYRPQCVRCDIVFKTKLEWDAHYVLTHLQQDEEAED